MTARAYGSLYWLHPQTFPKKWMKEIHAAFYCGPTGHLQSPQVWASDPQQCFGPIGMAPPDANLGAGSTAWAPMAAAIADALRSATRPEVHAFVRGLIQQTAEAARSGSELGPADKIASSTYARALLAAYP